MIKRMMHFVFFALIFLFFLEMASRFYLFGFNSLNFFKMNSAHALGYSVLTRPALPEIIYELKPGLDAYLKMARFRTNSQGLHDKEYSIHKPPDTFRVVVLGDSFVMPAGIEIENAFHSVLEERLNRESSSIKYEVINFGVSGYVPRQNLATLKYKALNYNPDLVLFCIGMMGSFNRWDIPEEMRMRIYRGKTRTRPFFESFFLKLLQTSRLFTFFKRTFTMTYGGDKDSFTEKPSPEHIKGLKNVFSQLQAIGEARHLPIYIILLGRHDNSDVAIEADILKKIAFDSGLFFFDTSVAFREVKSSHYILNELDWHPNIEAHKMLAAAIYDYLQKTSLLSGRRDGAFDTKPLSNPRK